MADNLADAFHAGTERLGLSGRLLSVCANWGIGRWLGFGLEEVDEVVIMGSRGAKSREGFWAVTVANRGARSREGLRPIVTVGWR